MAVPEKFKPLDGHLWAVPLHHIFGSEELSSHSAPVMERMAKPYILVHTADATEMNLAEGTNLSFEIDGDMYELPVKLSETLPKGLAGVPSGLDGLRFAELPAWALLKKTPAHQNIKS